MEGPDAIVSAFESILQCSGLDPSVYVIDGLPNMDAALVKERTEPLVRRLAAARPSAPILLGADSEDGSHPNDLGMMRYARALRPVLAGL